MGALDEFLSATPKIKVTRDELLLLDWILIFPAPAGQIDMDWHMKWKDLRLTIWNKIIHLPPATGEDSLELSEEDAGTLLCLVPTTFRWGQGDDCGYSLKYKLARFLLGEVDVEEAKDADKNTTQSETPTTGETTGGTMADTGEGMS